MIVTPEITHVALRIDVSACHVQHVIELIAMAYSIQPLLIIIVCLYEMADFLRIVSDDSFRHR